MNVLAVREAVKVAMAHARTEGPVMMEMDTYRYHGHSMPRAGPKKCARPRRPQPTALEPSWRGPCRLLAALRTRDAPPGLGGEGGGGRPVQAPVMGACGAGRGRRRSC